MKIREAARDAPLHGGAGAQDAGDEFPDSVCGSEGIGGSGYRGENDREENELAPCIQDVYQLVSRLTLSH